MKCAAIQPRPLASLMATEVATTIERAPRRDCPLNYGAVGSSVELAVFGVDRGDHVSELVFGDYALLR